MSGPRLTRREAIVLAGGALAFQSLGQAAEPHDVVIAGGRVLDPVTGKIHEGEVGVRDGKISTVTGRRLQGKVRLDASGKIVTAGFVDILANTHPEGDRYKVMDGVTTVLSTHGGPVEVAKWAQETQSRGPLVNFGTVCGHFGLRSAAGAMDHNVPATPQQVTRMAELAEQAHREGALGVGFGIEYIPGTSGQEVTALAEVAARHHTSIHAHIRLPHLFDPFQGINELIAAGAATGARVQVVHLGSMAIQRVKESLDLIDAARGRGVDIAADAYPYDAWMAPIQSAIFDDGWQQKYSLDYGDLVWVQTGERVTAATFPKFRAQGGHVACHQIREEDIRLALRHPLVSVASDGYIGEAPVSHPRGAGTFSRTLGLYVRERQVIPLPIAIRKMTVQPVERLQPGAPALQRKGRLAPGMDADITVFDPETVLDQSTFQNPKQYSRGITHVLVNGTVVVQDGKLEMESNGPGRWIRS